MLLYPALTGGAIDCRAFGAFDVWALSAIA
jgi:hypothetical protein